jgi:hypothetical protein
MISDMVVVDAIALPYDLALPNQTPAATEQLDAVYAVHEARALEISQPWSALRSAAAA